MNNFSKLKEVTMPKWFHGWILPSIEKGNNAHSPSLPENKCRVNTF